MNMECVYGHNLVDVFFGKESVFQFVPGIRITNVMVVKEVSGGRFSNNGRYELRQRLCGRDVCWHLRVNLENLTDALVYGSIVRCFCSGSQKGC